MGQNESASEFWKTVRNVRVIVGRLGGMYRLSAPDIDTFVDGSSFEEAWLEFLVATSARPDAAWLQFDVGPTRREEIEAALDAPEDEDCNEPVDPGAES